MGIGSNYFFGMLFSRMAIYAYLAGSGITTGLLYIGTVLNVVSIQTRLAESLPLFIEIYARVMIPLWVPPITQTDITAFAFNVFFGVIVLMYWTVKYTSAMGRRGF